MITEKKTPFFHKNRELLGEVLPLATPFTVIIDSSEVCNFKCSYCFRANDEAAANTFAKQEGLMGWDTFTATINQIKEFPQAVRRIGLSGHGEPLCNKLLPDMIHYIKSNGLTARTEIHTNASLLNEEIAKALANSGIDKVIVSLQGLNSAAYKVVSGVALDFNSFYEALKYFHMHKSNTSINIKIADIALEKDEETLFYEMFEGICDRMYIEKIVPLFKGVDYSNMVSNQMITNKYGCSFGEQQCCTQVFYTLFVSPNGGIYPCAELEPPLYLGNIKDTTLMEAWNSKERIALLKQHLAEGRFQNERCKDCYIPNNNIKTEADLIDDYREEILQRLNDK